MFIGDSVTHDIIGAKATGMTTILFNKRSVRNSDAADYTVAGVNELQNLLTLLI
ncbi:MAG: HAD hydrolase-like protein [Chloroflexi bacterium]|nr:HAD hydrolase-like protein [Chloroflexota bacterium]